MKEHKNDLGNGGILHVSFRDKFKSLFPETYPEGLIIILEYLLCHGN